jgi:hypothetical protein
MTLALTQNQIESQLSDTVPHGKRRDVARLTGTYESILYAYFNADDPRKSPQFETLAIQAALDHLGLGDEHWNAMCRLRDVSRPQSVECGALDEEAVANHRESFDVTAAVLNGKSLCDQLEEVDEQIRAAVRHKTAIIKAINNEKDEGGASRFSPRQFARQAVNGRTK